MEIISGIINSILKVFGEVWWVILPIALFFAVRDLWVLYLTDAEVKRLEWVILEIKVPKELLTTPKAMEIVFSSLYANYSHGFTFWQKYLDGLLDTWYSLEIVGHAHGVHFYAYIPKKMRNMVEAAIYAQYPEVEIHETEDYTQLLPEVLPNKTYNLWGSNLVLARDTFYPIRTYPFFEEVDEEKRLDPMANITEVMSNLKGEERLWYQVVVSPTGNEDNINNDYKEKGEAKIKEIAGVKSAPSKSLFGGIAEFFRNLVWSPIEHPIWGEVAKKDPSAIKFLTQAEQELVKAIDNKVSKLGFETTMRFIYIDKADTFSTANAVAMFGAIRQFNTQNLNFFKPGTEKTILSGWKPRLVPFYSKLKMFSQKKKLYSNYKNRRVGGRMVRKFRGQSSGKVNTMSSEELATLYHFPITSVGAPKLRRMPSKKGEPPAGLPLG